MYPMTRDPFLNDADKKRKLDDADKKKKMDALTRHLDEIDEQIAALYPNREHNQEEINALKKNATQSALNS